MDNSSFYVFDNFYEDPYAIRDMALNQMAWHPTKVCSSYPNGNAPWGGKMTKETYTDNNRITALVSKKMQKVLVPMGKSDHGAFRLTKESDSENHKIHADSFAEGYAGILYLTPNIKNIEGTNFYKNTRYNDQSLANADQIKEIIEFGTDDPAQWERSLTSYFVWNRLIVYSSSLYHAAGPGFGTTDEDGRLVQIFYWEEVI